MINVNILLILIFLPILIGIITLFVPKKVNGIKEALTLIGSAVNLVIAISLFGKEMNYMIPWGSFGFEISLRLYQFSAFITLAAAGFGVLVSLYSIVSMKGKEHLNQFYSYLLISLGMVNGAVLADNLVLLLFFWEGLLLTLFGMIVIGRKDAYKTAVKAFVIIGITDLCMMFGIGLTYILSDTLVISKISLPLTTLGAIAYIFLMIGAISKAGAMPFHSWIPDAAIDAPLPFMAFIPAALEKLLGIYFLARISLDMFTLTKESWVSTLLMIIGVVTIILAVMMALVQKDYKKLLSYHAISQVGYMVLGIGTAVPAGIIGGLFHMINHSMYKSCLFLTGGAVEKQTGTTDLRKLGGIGKVMPVTFVCFIIAAASISGVPPFNGFFSKELVYDGALERGLIYYIIAVLGSFFTAASFLKLGHAAFLGKVSDENRKVKEAPAPMLISMIVLALLCVLFGLYNALPLKNLIQPVLGVNRLQGHHFYGWPESATLVIVTLVVIAAAYLNHRYGVKKTGSGLGAVDHIHHAPVLNAIYDMAEKRYFDPYDIGLKIVDLISKIAWQLDRAIDWVYNVFSVRVAYAFTNGIKKAHNGNYSLYLLWAIGGLAIILIFAFYSV
jgi:formate hydrogenlyase subunit 3/multisubunit Na+/H+ antiporter MnhD subunit